MISKYINSGGFGLILLCILMPFFSIKCNDVKLMQFSGTDLVFGKTYNTKEEARKAFGENPFGMGGKKSIFDDEEEDESDDIQEHNSDESEDGAAAKKPAKTEETEQLKPNIFFILLELGALAGLILALASRSSAGIPMAVILVTQAICLIVAVIMFNSKMGMNQGAEMASFAMKIKLGYEIGFWLTALAIGGLLGYNIYYYNQNKKPEIPPLVFPPEEHDNENTGPQESVT